MPNEFSLQQRLAALEREVAQIKRHLTSNETKGNWVDEISGSMAAFPEFEEVVRLGREFRESVSDV
jgi:hypothetical protein